MHFTVQAWEVEGIGNLCSVKMSAMLGLMKMDTVVLTPLTVDAPLFSYDRIVAMGKDTLLVELYDTQLAEVDVSALDEIKKSAADLPDHDLGEHWYDPMKLSPSLAKRGKHGKVAYEELTEQFFLEYGKLLESAAACEKAPKQQKVRDYVDGLFSHGGPSTDQFKKLIGEEKARELFGKYVFGSEA